MNRQPLSQAHDADLRFSQLAMDPAAQRARELAAQTGTVLIISRHGVIERIAPSGTGAARTLQEPAAPYGKQP